MGNDNLRVSIGLPVFNGEKYLAQALDSLMAQTFGDFELNQYQSENYMLDLQGYSAREQFTHRPCGFHLGLSLVVADNASADRTQEICQDYAARDRRIRYQRNQKNIGRGNNHNLTFRLSRGQYFRWAARDGLCAPELVARCAEVLDQQAKGHTQHPCEPFRYLAFRNYSCDALWGMTCSDTISKVRLQFDCTDANGVLLCGQAALGRFCGTLMPLHRLRHGSVNR